MAANLISKAEVTIHANASKVWDGLINPDLIKEYFFGMEAISDWNVGSAISFKGAREGKPYTEKGTILRIETNKLLQFTNYSPFAGLEDTPENYTNITYELHEEAEGITTLTVRQENIANEQIRDMMEANWKNVLDNMKKVIETEKHLA